MTHAGPLVHKAMLKPFMAFSVELDARINERQAELMNSAETPQWTGLLGDVVALATDSVRCIRGGMAGVDEEVLEDYFYLLCAWADDRVLTRFGDATPAEAIGGAEQRAFGTREAGERIFLKIQESLNRGGHRYGALNAVYLLALSMGFEGQYRQDTGNSQLAEYRNRLRQAELTGVELVTPLSSQLAQDTRNMRLARQLRRYNRGVLFMLTAVLVAVCSYLEISYDSQVSQLDQQVHSQVD